jgi:RimJ/RimL family protein N-acetyltransferase
MPIAHGRAALGYWILPAERRKGFPTTALNALSTWALALDDIERLELGAKTVGEVPGCCLA